MYYFDSLITHSTAEAIIIPVCLDGVIKPGSLQHAMLKVLPDAYMKDYFRECRNGHLDTEQCTVFVPETGPWKDRAVFNLPALRSDKKTINIAHVARALVRCGGVAKFMEASTIAIGHPCPDLLDWDTAEDMLEDFEGRLVDARMELWVYPPDTPVPDEEKEEGLVVAV